MAGPARAATSPIVIGFAAETDGLIPNAQAKLSRKGCDAIVANQVGSPENPVFGRDETAAHWITKTVHDDLGPLSKHAVAAMIVSKVTQMLADREKEKDKAA